jgi:hypothetical protein
LFKEGREALGLGEYDVACAKLAESEALEPAPGTLFNLADCEEKRLHLSRAHTLFNDVLPRVAPDEDVRRAQVLERLTALDKRLPKLVVQLDRSAPAGTKVTRNDTVVPGVDTAGVVLRVDPGKHVITATADGRPPQTFTVSLAEGETKQITVAPGPPRGLRPQTGAPAPSSAPDPAHSIADRGSARGPVGLVAGGIGLAAVAAGVTVGIVAKSEYDTAADHCKENLCDATGFDIRQSARGKGGVATALFIAGAATAVGGTVLWLTAPSGQAAPAAKGRIAIGMGAGAIVAKAVW